MASGGLCIGCLFPPSLLACSVAQTSCCNRPICFNCTQSLPSCPVCRLPIVLAGEGAPKTQPPPYAVPDDHPPSYNPQDAEAQEGEAGGAARGQREQEGGEDDDEVPAYDYNAHAASFLDVAELQTTEDGISAIHYISSHDTLVGISLKYNVPVAAIRKANKMFSNNIHEREKLIIPGVNQLPKSISDPSDEMKEEREKIRKTKRFQVATKCLDNTEAKYYLEQAKFDVDQAVRQYLEDLEWESKHPLKSRASTEEGGQERSSTTAPSASASAPFAPSPSVSSAFSFPLFSGSSMRERSSSRGKIFGLF